MEYTNNKRRKRDMDKKEQLKNRIKVVEREIRNEPDRHKKQRLNKYKQKLEIELRDYIRSMNL